LLGKNNVSIKAIIILAYFFSSIAFAISLEVNIYGVNKELVELIKSDLTIHEAITEPKLTKRRINNLYDLAAIEIHSTLEACGYYNATITPEILMITGLQIFILNLGVQR
jgi:hypothetical protein